MRSTTPRCAFFAAAAIAVAVAPTFAPAQAAPAAAVFEARNTLDIRRDDQVVALPWEELTAALPGLVPNAVRVIREGGGAELPSQPVDLDADGTPEELLFLASFWPDETVVVRVEPVPASPVEPRVHVYHDADRDDVAWESDRIAFRTYGQGLWALEDLVSSGIDVLTKRVPALVLDRWYAGGDYHIDRGEGADFFSVGSSLGAGGTAIFRGGELHPAPNFAGYRILADGPIRAVAELEYDPYPAGDLTVSETRRISIDAGSNLFRQETRYAVDGDPSDGESAPLTRAVGIVRRPALVVAGSLRPLLPWLAAWQPVENGGHGHLGTAVILPPDGSALDRVGEGDGTGPSPLPIREIDGHVVLLQSVDPGSPAIHYVGAGWTAAGRLRSPEDWWRYLGQEARRLASPIEVRRVER
jgi:pectinesterase